MGYIQEARENHVKKKVEEALRSKMKQKALKQCEEHATKYAQCATGRTMSVVWQCRKQAKELNECLHQYCVKRVILDSHSPNGEGDIEFEDLFSLFSSRNEVQVSLRSSFWFWEGLRYLPDETKFELLLRCLEAVLMSVRGKVSIVVKSTGGHHLLQLYCMLTNDAVLEEMKREYTLQQDVKGPLRA
ncbi:hypothetical protein POTOM_055247 [Populus tomentosa]|uniref:COX assembly mitochondrial protein n=1 Tax=Populus tomentosa TaxID=118781 RepID=A0A8X8BZ13_POPTO|nr:hypothetical protein POTOM_055247 [Populus tomentosa]